VNRLKQLIHEIHRRSLWQVLGIYVVASWAVLQVADTFASALGLPDWFPPLALGLLVVGLPIVLATAFVQEGMGSRPVAGEIEPGSAAADAADTAGAAPVGARSEAPESNWLRGLLTWRNAVTGGVLAFALWGVVAAGWLLAGGTVRAPTGEAAAADALVRTIAVLPLANLSPDPDHAYFADGVHEEILGTLSRIADLTVLSRQAVLQYRDSDKTMAEIGGELRAGSVVEGSVRRDGSSVRVTVQLIDAVSDGHVWSENYDRTLTAGSIFDIQTEIAENIALALRATLTPAEKDRIASRRTDDLEAYDYYSRGRAAYATYALDGYDEAIRLFREAIASDSGYAPAWAGLADGLRQRAGNSYAGTDYHEDGVLQWADSADAAARKAIALASADADGYKALAGAMQYRQLHAKALEANLRALELDPNHWAATYNLGGSHQFLGRLDEALRWFKRARRLDPLAAFPGTQLLVVYARLGEEEIADRLYDEHRARFPSGGRAPGTAARLEFYRGDADAAYRVAARESAAFPESSPTLAMHAQAAAAVGSFEEAAAAAAKALRLAPLPAGATGGHNSGGRHAGAFFGYALSRTGQIQAGRAELKRVLAYRQAELDRGVDDVSLPWKMAAIHSALGNTDEALELVEQAYEAGYQPGRGYATMDPLLDSIRDDPRFGAVMEKSLADLEAMRRRIEAEEIAAGER
jgi:TolB-like protein